MIPYLVLVLAAWSGVVHAQTQANYCKINPQNTLCLYSPSKYSSSCPTIIPTKMTEADKKLIVDLHNNLRSKVARGLELRGVPGPQPKASNMRALTWDDELALMAETHVRQCVVNNDANRDVARFSVGQNLASRKSRPNNGFVNWGDIIEQWYDVVSDFNATWVNKFTPEVALSGNRGLYTAIVWANTYKIGCSVANWLDSQGWYTYLYACNYGPGGDILYQPVYLVGPPSSACPAGTSPNISIGLCE